MTYRAELSARALKQMQGLPGPAFDSLVRVMAGQSRRDLDGVVFSGTRLG